MAPGPGGSPFRARWDATSVSLYSVVNEPGGLFSPHPVFHTFFGFDSPSVGTFFQGKSSHPIFQTFLWFERKVFQKNFLTLYFTLFSGFTTCRRKLFSGKVPLTLYSTLFSRLDEKIIKLFLRKDGRHSLDFANRIRKTSFTKSFFGQRKSRKRKPDRLIPVGALGK